MTDEHDKKSSVDESTAPGEHAAPDRSAPATAQAHRSGSDTDPLAELIRMVKEEDPFADVLARKSGPLAQRATPKVEGAAPAPDEARQPGGPTAPEAPRGTPVPPRETTAAPHSFARAPRADAPRADTSSHTDTSVRPDAASPRFAAPQEPKEPVRPVAPPSAAPPHVEPAPPHVEPAPPRVESSAPRASGDDAFAKRPGESEQDGPDGGTQRASSGLSLGLRRGDATDDGTKGDEMSGDRFSGDAEGPKSAGNEGALPVGPAVPPAVGAEPSAEDAPAHLRSWMRPSPSADNTSAATRDGASPAPAPQAGFESAPPAPSAPAPESVPEEPREAPALDPVDLERALRDFRDAPEHVLRADASWHDNSFEDEPGHGDVPGWDPEPEPQAPAAPPPAYSAPPTYAPAAFGAPAESAAPSAEAPRDVHGEFDPVDPYDDPAFDDFDAQDYRSEAGEDPYRGGPAEPYLSEEAIEETVDERLDEQGASRQAVAFQHAARHEPKPRRRGTFFAVGILLGLVVLGGGFAYVMSGDTAPADGEAPILRADNAPSKIEPDDPGGANIPNQNRLVFDRVSGEASGGEEQIVSREEEIIEPAEAARQAGRMSDGGGMTQTPSDGSTTPATASQVSGQQAALSPNGSSAGVPLAPVPRRVKTMVVRPDGSIVPAEEPEPMSAGSEPAAPPTPAPAVSAVASEPDPGEKTAERAVSALNNGARQGGTIPAPPTRPQDASAPAASSRSASPVTPVRPVRGAPMQLNPNPVTGRTANTGSSAAPAPESAASPSSSASRQVASATPSAAPAPSPSGQYVVQLAARKNEAQAQVAYDALKAKYRNLLGRYQPLIQRADLGDRGVYYRVRVGPMATADAAGELCNQLKAAGLSDCLVRQR